MRPTFRILTAFCALVMLSGAAPVERPHLQPRIGAPIDMDLVFADAQGKRLPLRAIFDGKPALILFGYDECPNLCGVAQRALAGTLSETSLDPSSYRALFVSIDPEEGPAQAGQAKATLAKSIGEEAIAPWRFLTGDEATIGALANALGIDWLKRTRLDQFVHPVAVMAMTPEGKLARVLPDLGFSPRDLRLALVEASQGKLGTVGEHILLLCAGYDVNAGQYTPVITIALQIASMATVAALGGLVLFLSWRRRA